MSHTLLSEASQALASDNFVTACDSTINPSVDLVHIMAETKINMSVKVIIVYAHEHK